MKLAPALFIATTLAAALPAHAARYRIDPDHTFPSLEFSHMDVSTWRGRFNRTSGVVTLDRAARKGTADIRVETDSIDFGLQSMHDFAIKPDWLNVAAFPVMSYRGELEFQGDVPVAINGNLTLRGVTKPLKLTIDHFKCVEHPMLKREVCGGDITGEMNRADWGMSQYAEGRMGIVKLKIQVEGILEPGGS